MLGQPVSMLIPRVVGFKLTGEIPAGATATDVVLTITEMLRKHGVVGKFVEFYGEGVGAVPLANRATIGNMSPEFGSTAAIFPIDDVTCDYLRLTGRSDAAGRARRGVRQGAGPVARPGHASRCSPSTSSSTCPRWCPSIAGPKRPQDRIALTDAKDRVPGGPGRLRRRRHRQRRGRGQQGVVPGERPARLQRAPRRPGAQRGAAPGHPGAQLQRPAEPQGRADHGRRHADRARPRRRGDRLDHLVHQHLQPVGDGRGRAAGQERRRARADGRSRGSRPRWRPAPRSSRTTTRRPASCPTWRSSATTWSATAAPPASATPARCPRRSRRRSRRTTSPSSRCCPATATSRAGSTPTSR